MQEYESIASKIFHTTMKLVKQHWGKKYTDIDYTEIIQDYGSEKKIVQNHLLFPWLPSWIHSSRSTFDKLFSVIISWVNQKNITSVNNF